MTDLQRIADRLGRAKKTPAGFLCQCPCHDDKEASLSLKITDNGKLAVRCFAGCDWKKIYEYLKSTGLLPNSHTDTRTGNRRSKDWSEIQTIYSYRDESGTELFQKIRLKSGKKGIHRYWSEETINKRTNEKGDWIYREVMKNVRNVLYNLPEVIAAPVVYLCEGEKDADTLYKNHGLVATTNNAGAASWDDSFDQFFKGKVVIICQDNDDAGRKRTKKLGAKLQGIAKEIRVFVPPNVAEHGDVTDWIEAGGDALEIYRLSESYTPKTATEKATRDQYFDLYESVLGSPKKCIFSEKLMTIDRHTALWNPAVNYLDILKSEAAVLNETPDAPKFEMGLVQPHFFAYEATKTPEFLIDLPQWDGEERIKLMALACKMRENTEITSEHFEELLKEWMARMFQRLHDPNIQNHILVLQGGQGIGKDTWVGMLVDGLGQFAIPLSVIKEDKDTFLNLHRGLVMKISEFDKTARTEVSTLKDIITTPQTNLRAPYDRDSKVRMSRCSFISSANIENILRDYTGNRRYMIFELEEIEFFYKNFSDAQRSEWRMQILAEGAALAAAGFVAGEAAREAMNAYIKKKTPDDPADDTLTEYVRWCTKRFDTEMFKTLLTEFEMAEAFQEIRQVTGLSVRAIREQLRRKVGYYRQEDGVRQWHYHIRKLESRTATPTHRHEDSPPFERNESLF